MKISKISHQNNSERVTNKNNQEKLKERYISPDERQELKLGWNKGWCTSNV